MSHDLFQNKKNEDEKFKIKYKKRREKPTELKA